MRPRLSASMPSASSPKPSTLPERHVVRTMGVRARCNQRMFERGFTDRAGIGRELHAMWAQEFHGGKHAAHRVAHELVLQHLDFMIERLLQALDQIAGRDALLDA